MYMYIVPHLPLLRPHIWQVVAPGTRSRSGWLGGSGETSGLLAGEPRRVGGTHRGDEDSAQNCPRGSCH